MNLTGFSKSFNIVNVIRNVLPSIHEECLKGDMNYCGSWLLLTLK